MRKAKFNIMLILVMVISFSAVAVQAHAVHYTEYINDKWYSSTLKITGML